jgi:cellulose synthase/poly-beta-1,6-N-acetylglucosamine synthase-like glycosyltransferase
MTDSTAGTNRLRISVIIPVRDEEDTIRALLDRLLAQTRPADEVIITDGGSKDRTPDIIDEYVGAGAPVRLIRAGAALPGRGRNLAAERATSEWLAFIDAGTRPVADWIELLVKQVESDASVDVVFGAWEPRVESFFEECAAVAYAFELPVVRDGVLISPPCVGSSLVRREVWREVGGFAEDLRSGEDILFMDKIDAGKFPVAYAPRAIVRWDAPPTIGQTFKRFALYSRHNLRAGLWREWHATVLGRYVLLLVALVSALAFGARWIAVVALLWLLLIAARAVVATYRKRGIIKRGRLRGALRLVALVPLIATIDAATITGALHWLFADKLRLAGGATK